MRIVSLAPSVTELLFALDLGDEIVGVTHACDHPAAARILPRVTRARPLDELGTAGPELDVDLLHELAPDLIVTQGRWDLGTLTEEDVRELAEELDSQPMVIALDPHTVGEVLGDARTIAQATDTKDVAVDLIRESSERIDRVRLAVRRAARPRVVALEWLDPPATAGYWTPQLIEYAGGEDALGFAGEPAEEVSWDVVAAAEPEIVLIMPRGFSAEIAHREAEMHRDRLASLGARKIVAVDAASYFSRPGPRIVDALELLAQILHPDLVGENSEYEGKALTVELDL